MLEAYLIGTGTIVGLLVLWVGVHHAWLTVTGEGQGDGDSDSAWCGGCAGCGGRQVGVEDRRGTP